MYNTEKLIEVLRWQLQATPNTYHRYQSLVNQLHEVMEHGFATALIDNWIKNDTNERMLVVMALWRFDDFHRASLWIADGEVITLLEQFEDDYE
jgi:hypothetical protein